MLQTLTAAALAALPGKAREVVVALGESLSNLEVQSVELAASNADLEERNAKLEAIKARLDSLDSELRQALFEQRSEKQEPDDRQLAFEDLKTAIAETEAAAETIIERPKTKRPSSRNIGHLLSHFPRIEKRIEPESTDCVKGCGTLTKIGGRPHRAARRHPGAQLQVIVTVRHRRHYCGLLRLRSTQWIARSAFGRLTTKGAAMTRQEWPTTTLRAGPVPMRQSCSKESRGRFKSTYT